MNRTLYKAQELAAKFSGTAYSLELIDEPLIKSKCLFSCTGSLGYVINSDLLIKNYNETGYPKLIIQMESQGILGSSTWKA